MKENTDNHNTIMFQNKEQVILGPEKIAGQMVHPQSFSQKFFLPSAKRFSMMFHDIWWWLQYMIITLPETDIAPENRPSQKETSIPNIHVSAAMLVSGKVYV